MKMLAITCFAICGMSAMAEELTVDQIMTRVAENQDRAQEMRGAFLYNQKVQARFNRANGKLAREEKLEYQVAPKPNGVEKKLTHFEGKYERKGKFVEYDKPGEHYKGLDVDGDLIRDMVNDMTGDKESKDGVARDLFPLTCEEQGGYNFTLEGKETYHGREVYRVSFRPKEHVSLVDADEGEANWKGYALIDAEEFQPLVVNTKLATHIPTAVKVLLGTDIKGLGFSVSYQKFDEGLWFPVSYGGEFYVRAVFFYKRHMSISMVNSGFERALVTSHVAYDTSGK